MVTEQFSLSNSYLYSIPFGTNRNYKVVGTKPSGEKAYVVIPENLKEKAFEVHSLEQLRQFK